MDQCRIQYPPLACAYCSKGACDNDHRIHEYVSTSNLMHHAYNFLSTLNGAVQAFGSFYSVLDVYFHVPKTYYWISITCCWEYWKILKHRSRIYVKMKKSKSFMLVEEIFVHKLPKSFCFYQFSQSFFSSWLIHMRRNIYRAGRTFHCCKVEILLWTVATQIFRTRRRFCFTGAPYKRIMEIELDRF